MNELTQEDIEKMRQLEIMKRVVFRKMMTKKAVERLSRIRLVKPELVDQIELYFLQLYQTGQIKQAITDDQLREILNAITQKKRFNIKR